MTDFNPNWSSKWAETVVAGCLIVSAAIGVALIGHAIIVSLAKKFARSNGSSGYEIFIRRLSQPTRWITIGIALSLSARALPLDASTIAIIQQFAAFTIPILVGWIALSTLRATNDVVIARSDITASDNLAARRKRTRIGILSRIGAFAIIFVTICMMLLSIPGVRSVGVTLMASAGLAGLAVGAAAQPALKNLIAGIQMAFSEPIRIDDVVIMDGEWGRIEEIRLTYVVVRIWDQRRLIVPISKFLEETFQNWTRDSSELLGTAFFYVDPTADIEGIRRKLDEIVRGNPKWDGRVIGLQVTDIKPEVMELRALVSAADAGRAFDLRCDVRETLMTFIASSMPSALPKRRAEFSSTTSTPGNPQKLERARS